MVAETDILNAKILIVDDQEANVRLIEKTLQEAGYTSIAVTLDSREVCEMHRINKYELILLDLEMAGMDGFEVMAGLKEIEPWGYLPVLVLTVEPEHKLRALQAGARDFLSKPFDLMEVLTRARNLIELRLLHAECREHSCVLEHNLVETQENLRRIENAVKVGLWDWNLKTQEVHYSPECKHQLGYADDEMEDCIEAWTVRMHPEDRAGALECTARYIAQRDFPYSQEYRLQHKDGSYRWILEQGSILYDESGLPEQLLGSHVDITEHKRLEEQFQRAQRMESIGMLAGGIAHDFNNLLGVILGYTDLCLHQLPETGTFKRELEQIDRAGTRAAELTHRLLAFSRKQVFQLQVMNLNCLLLESRKMMQRIVREDIELVYRLATNLGNVKADPGQLEQVLLNLVVNACDAMPDGGTLTLETQEEEVPADQFPSEDSLMAGPYVTLSVGDTGYGMDGQTVLRVFDPFFTTKGMGKGTGLGLPSVYGIVHQSSGSIQVVSELEVGTTFKIFLPLVTAPVHDMQPVRGEGSNRGTGLILMVEDDDALRTLCKRILTDAGYTVLAASGGAEALALLDHEPRPVRLLVTDIVMPHMSGPELSERIRVSGKRMKTLYISGYVENAMVRHLTSEGSGNFLGKPFTAEALTMKIHRLLNIESSARHDK